MHCNFNTRYTIFFNGDLSGEIEWFDKEDPDRKKHIIPEDVVKLIKNACLTNFANILHDRVIDELWEEYK